MTERNVPAISVCFASRGRPGSLTEALDSLWQHADNSQDLEAIVAVDPDDTDTTRYARLQPGARLWTAPERYGYTGLHHYLNRLAPMANGTWIMWFNDDMRMTTRGWDTIVQGMPEGILWPEANHVQHANIAPIWPKRWTDHTGIVTPTTHMDTWLQYAAEALGRHYKIPVHIVHDRADVTGNHDDQTYAEGRKLLGSEGMAPDWEQTRGLLPGWIDKVRELVEA